MALSLEGRMGGSPYKIGGFLSSVLLSWGIGPCVHSTHLGPHPPHPHGTWEARGTHVNRKFTLPEGPRVINYPDARDLVAPLSSLLLRDCLISWPLGARVWRSPLLRLLLMTQLFPQVLHVHLSHFECCVSFLCLITWFLPNHGFCLL